MGRADVFVQNLVPAAAERLGLKAEALCARFPRLIACRSPASATAARTATPRPTT